MSTLVTGIDGLVGERIAARLRERRERVVGHDDLRRLTEAIAEHDVRGIVHAAELPRAARLLEEVRLAGFRGRTVLLSFSAVRGHRARPLPGQVYVHRYGLDVVTLRVGEVYGRGRGPSGVVQDVIDAALAGRSCRLRTGADQPRRPVHAEDVARAALAALDAPCPPARIYDITGGEQVTLAHVVALLRDRLPDADIALGPGRVPGHGGHGPVAVRTADRELGYRPRWGLARGIDDLCTWWESLELTEGAA
jgi:nucleoside-diphosphate-sugar epimerase